MVGQKLDVLKWYEVKGGLRLKLDVHVTLSMILPSTCFENAC